MNRGPMASTGPLLRIDLILSGEVRLAETAESGAAQNRDRAIIVVHMNGECSLSARPHQQGISEMDVDLGHEKRGEKFRHCVSALPEFDTPPTPGI